MTTKANLRLQMLRAAAALLAPGGRLLGIGCRRTD